MWDLRPESITKETIRELCEQGVIGCPCIRYRWLDNDSLEKGEKAIGRKIGDTVTVEEDWCWRLKDVRGFDGREKQVGDIASKGGEPFPDKD